MTNAAETAQKSSMLKQHNDKAALLDHFASDESAKCVQILDGAREVFLAKGFDGASMNDVAKAAGVSKGTLYVYFSSKEKLFEHLIRVDRSRQAEQLCQFDSKDHDVRRVLQNFGTRLMEAMTRPAQIAHIRIIIGAVAKFPTIGQAFYEAGPMIAIARLSAWLSAQSASGVLFIEDTDYAAEQFLDLCQTHYHKRVVFGMIDQPNLEEIEANVARAVKTFLKVYSGKSA